MSRYSSPDVGFLLVGGRDLLPDTYEIEDDENAVIEDTTVIGSSAEEHTYVGVRNFVMRILGFYNDTALRNNEALVTPGASSVICYTPTGNVLGRRFIGAGTVQANFKRMIARAELTKAEATFRIRDKFDKGIVLHTLKAETAASGDTEGADSQDNAASTLIGGTGYVQCTALTLGGYTSVTVKVRHSADDIAYSDLVTFANITSAPTSERKEVTGTVNRYLAHSWLFNGAGAGQTITYFVGFARNVAPL